MRDAPPYELKTVPDHTIKMIRQRYKASNDRLENAYPCGESITSIANTTHYHLCFLRCMWPAWPFLCFCPIGEPYEETFTHTKHPFEVWLCADSSRQVIFCTRELFTTGLFADSSRQEIFCTREALYNGIGAHIVREGGCAKSVASIHLPFVR